MRTYELEGGVGHPWGVAFDAAGNLWFAEPGCDLSPRCPPGQPPGQIGVLRAGAPAPDFYTLPPVPGNQPLFVALDAAGAVWFTTPANDRIGRFDPRTATFEQWLVSPNSGPWQLAFAEDGALWFTEHFSSALGRFDPLTHSYAEFRTPTANSQPYGLAVSGSSIWFTENVAGVGRIGMLDTAAGNTMREFVIRARPSPDLTPHMIAVDRRGNVWWTEGFERDIGRLVPSRATPGSCGRTTGSCIGVAEYDLPPPSCGRTHGSGIVASRVNDDIWFTDSLAGEVGKVDALTGSVEITRLRDCTVHAHDGLALDPGGTPWFSQQFTNEIVHLIPEPD